MLHLTERNTKPAVMLLAAAAGSALKMFLIDLSDHISGPYYDLSLSLSCDTMKGELSGRISPNPNPTLG